jgi:hypothetical protein
MDPLLEKKQQNLKFNGGVKHDNIAKLEDCEYSTKLTMNINQNLNKMSMNSKINYELERKLNKVKFEHCVSIRNILQSKEQQTQISNE